MHWIYLSPHLDDVALSCAGLVWEQSQAGDQVSVLTVCAGDPPDGPISIFARSLQDRWRTGVEAMAVRRQEDLDSCAEMGATAIHLSIPDCIYRRPGDRQNPVCDSEESLTAVSPVGEERLILSLTDQFRDLIPNGGEIVCPLTLGGHVDHVLTRNAAEKLDIEFWYYVDYPYVDRKVDTVYGVIGKGWTSQLYPISRQGLRAWQRAVAAHTSQISTFWPDTIAMSEDIDAYYRQENGVRLWRKV